MEVRTVSRVAIPTVIEINKHTTTALSTNIYNIKTIIINGWIKKDE